MTGKYSVKERRDNQFRVEFVPEDHLQGERIRTETDSPSSLHPPEKDARFRENLTSVTLLPHTRTTLNCIHWILSINNNVYVGLPPHRARYLQLPLPIEGRPDMYIIPASMVRSTAERLDGLSRTMSNNSTNQPNTY